MTQTSQVDGPASTHAEMCQPQLKITSCTGTIDQLKKRRRLRADVPHDFFTPSPEQQPLDWTNE